MWNIYTIPVGVKSPFNFYLFVLDRGGSCSLLDVYNTNSLLLPLACLLKTSFYISTLHFVYGYIQVQDFY